MNLPKTIDELILEMDVMLDEAISKNSRMGYFVALYQKVTIKVKEGIADGRFEDGERMEKLDVVFANRYLKAYQLYKSGKTPTRAWQAAFDAAKRSDLLLLQDLLLGMNAHINLDLGIAAAEISTKETIQDLDRDFKEINQILSELIDEVQIDIAKVSPFFGLIDFVTNKKDEAFAAFSLKAARKHAWFVAQQMVAIPSNEKEGLIERTDNYVLELSQLILKPGRLISMISWIIRLIESKDIAKNIKVLRFRKRSV